MSSFSIELAREIEESAESITRDWVERLASRLDEERRQVLPSQRLLNDVPGVLCSVARFVREPEAEIATAAVVEDIQALAELRRRQGFSVSEILSEYEILSAIVQERAEEVAARLSVTNLEDVVRATGRLKDSLLILGTLTVHSHRRWIARQARERNETLAWFAEVLGHELKNRLGAAETAAHVLQESWETLGDAKRDELLGLLIDSVTRSRATVDDVAGVARGLDGTVPRGPRMILGTVIHAVVNWLAGKAERAGIRLEVQGEIPEVLVHAGHLQVILTNLIDNAVRYHDSRSDDPHVLILVAPVEPEGSVRIAVEDDGPGMPAELADLCFDRTVRGANGDEDGSGLGLAVVREAVEQLGGELRLETEPGVGSRFSVLLPPRAFVEHDGEGQE